MKYLVQLSIFFIFLCHFSVKSQQTWTLKMCIDTAFKKNISINQGQLNSRINGINLLQSRVSVLPTLNLNDSQSLNAGYSLDPYTYQYTNQKISINNLSLNSSVTLFNGHVLLYTVKQNKLLYEAGMLDIDKVKNDIMLYVLAGYMQVLMDYEAVKVAQAQIDASNVQVEQTKKFVQFGKLVQLNLFQIESQLATDKLAKINADNQLQLDKLTLLQLMETPVRVDFEIEQMELKELFPQIPMSTEAINDVSLSFLPQIKSASLKTSAAQAGVKMAQSVGLPKLTMGGVLKTGYSSVRSDVLSNQLKNNFSQGISFTLAVPIFNNLLSKSGVAIARVNVLKASLDELQTKNDLRKNIETVYTNQVSSGRKLVAISEQMELERRTYTDMEKKYSVGVLSATDFVIEKNNYNRVSMSLIQAKYDYVLRTKMVDFYLGKPLNLD
ncbi:MAG: TolC family protein [Bacteroidota bacterium]